MVLNKHWFFSYLNIGPQLKAIEWHIGTILQVYYLAICYCKFIVFVLCFPFWMSASRWNREKDAIVQNQNTTGGAVISIRQYIHGMYVIYIESHLNVVKTSQCSDLVMFARSCARARILGKKAEASLNLFRIQRHR